MFCYKRREPLKFSLPTAPKLNNELSCRYHHTTSASDCCQTVIARRTKPKAVPRMISTEELGNDVVTIREILSKYGVPLKPKSRGVLMRCSTMEPLAVQWVINAMEAFVRRQSQGEEIF